MARYRIAGLQVEMQPQGLLLQSRSRRYLTQPDGSPDMVLPVLGDSLSEEEEYSEAARFFYERLLPFDGFLLHASAVAYKGRAYAFSAPSGTGKSTHAALWKRELGARIINDDKPAIRRINGAFCACGTPFSGKTDQSENLCVPLGGIALLERAAENTVTPLVGPQALWALLNQTLRPKEKVLYERLLDLLTEVLKSVPVWRIGCTPEKEAALIACAAMTKERDGL